MSEAKKNSLTELIENFTKDQYTNTLTGDDQLIDNFSVDFFNKHKSYVTVIFVNSNRNDCSNPIGINNQNFLSKSEETADRGKKIFNSGTLKALLDNCFANQQTDNFSKSEERKKTRLLVKRGVAHISLLLADIALIYTRNKLAYVIERNSKKYSIDKTLTELEQELDHSIFFRANRQYIVNLNFIKSFKAYQTVKLLLDINISELEEPVIISQQLSPAFKKWMNDA